MKKKLKDFLSIEIKNSHVIFGGNGPIDSDDDDGTGGNGSQRPKGSAGSGSSH